MFISRNWLSDYVDLSGLTDADFENLVTTKVAEVEGVTAAGDCLEKGIVGEIISRETHAERDGLSIVNVSLGSDSVQLICGAANCEVGTRVAYIPPGGSCLDRKTGEKFNVEVREVAGVSSAGVLVSEAEIGVGADSSGLVVIPESFAVGTSLTEVFGPSDLVIEIDNKSVTHRPDLWGHFGFARELSAILGRELKTEIDLYSDFTEEGSKSWADLCSETPSVSVSIEKDSGCRRFSAIRLDGVSVEPSPLWMRRRLFTIGAGVRNFLVDLSNYVMFDVGQPNHAYDGDKLQGKELFVRRGEEGEKFTGLDEIERTLSSSDIVIADGGSVVALGGVIGGLQSSIQNGTTSLVLESANFDPVAIRKSTKRHQLRTDASNRFEKNRSPYAVPLGTRRFIELLCEEQSDVRVSGGLSDCFPEVPSPISISVDIPYIQSRLGPEVSETRIREILGSLHFAERENGSEVLVPFYRASRDVQGIDDLVEEVGRIYGYENIEERPPLIASTAARFDAERDLEQRLKMKLSGLGFNEVYNYSFTSADTLESLGYDLEKSIELENPVDATQGRMRTTLVPAMLEVLEKNSKNFDELALFEVGRVYTKDSARKSEREPGSRERKVVSVGFCSGIDDGGRKGISRPDVSEGSDFYATVAVVTRLLTSEGVHGVSFVPIADECGGDEFGFRRWMHPMRAAQIVTASGTVLGVIAEVSPQYCKVRVGRPVVAEFGLGLLGECIDATVEFEQISKYPDSFFEMSVVMPKRSHYAELRKLLLDNTDTKLLKNVEVLSVYEGKPLSEDEKSVSVKMYFGASDRTLDSEEVSSLQVKLMSAIEESPYHLRR